MMKIEGHYKFIKDNKIILSGKNLITLLGESFFINRWINDEFKPLEYIVLGTGTSRPTKQDMKLAKQKIIKNCNTKVDLKNKQLILSCDCTTTEILGITEIGTSNGEILVSRDIFEEITEELIGENNTSTVHIEYSFTINTGSIRYNWTLSQLGNNIYYVYEPNKVVGVMESNNNSGYVRKNSIEELTNGSYYYDSDSKNLYIKNTEGNDPNTKSEIIIQTR